MLRRVPAEDTARATARLAALGVRRLPRGWVPPADEIDETVPAELDLPEATLPEVVATSRWAERLRWEPRQRAVVALAGVALAAAFGAGAVVLRSRPEAVPLPAVDAPGMAIGASPAPTGEVVVSVAGKVRRPGLVRLPAGARVDDAVRAAGGSTGSVGLLNLARRVVDGEQVLVGVGPPAGAQTAGGSGTGKVDLNTATVADLDALPGIGPVLAQRIVDWRSEHGRFASVDQLREVSGIGESKYVQLKAKVVV